MTPSLWWWAVPAVLLCWSIGAHNRLVRQRAQVLQALAEVEAYLRQWTGDALALDAAALIPSEAAAATSDEPAQPALSGVPAVLDVPDASDAPDPPTAASAPQAPIESAVPADPPAALSPPAELIALHAAARQADTARAALRPRPLEPDALAALAAACDVLATASQRIEDRVGPAALATATQAIASPAAAPAAPLPTPSTAPAPSLLAQHAAHLRVARGRFNAAVARYHAAIGQFPACLLAWLLRMPRTRSL